MGRRRLLRDTVLADAHLNDNAEAGYQRWSITCVRLSQRRTCHRRAAMLNLGC
jgi:hypothetical protein